MAFITRTFEDIVNAVAEELKLDPNDNIEMDRLRRDVNMVYSNVASAPGTRFAWLSRHKQIEFKPFLSNGTVAVTPDSTTITFSTPPATSKAGYMFALENFSEIYYIESHAAGSLTAQLASPFTGQLYAAVAYKVWTDSVILPTDCRETQEVYHQFSMQPMEGIGLQEFRRRVALDPKRQGRPEIYCTYDYEDPSAEDGETESDRYLVMRVYPALNQNSTTLNVDYIREAVALELPNDEPMMPIDDRPVLVYGALERAWKRMRNTEAGEQSKRDFQEKLANMQGRITDSQDTPQITPSSQYLARKRGRMVGRGTGTGVTSAGSYTAPSYLKGAVIEGAQVTANISVNPGVTIDGVDISALGSTVDGHITQVSGAHAATAISVNPVGGIVAIDVQGALQQISAAQEAASTAAGIPVVPIGNLEAEQAQEAFEELQGDIDLLNSDLTDHVTDLTNPHAVTKLQVGLGNVDDTSDATKDSAVATLTNKTLVSPVINSPTGLVKADVGLSNVDNTSDATKNSAVATLTNKTLTSPVLNTPVINAPTGLVKADVGLSNVDNTSDATKNAAVAVLTNKDIDGGTASNTSRITIPKNTKANLDGLTRKEGTIVYGTDTTKTYIDNGTSLITVGSGSGGGGGSLNYIKNPDFEADLAGYATYVDHLRVNNVDLLGDGIDLVKNSSGGAVQAGDLSAGQRLRYQGLSANGGMTLNTDYYLVGSVLGYGTNASWGVHVSTTQGGAPVDITSAAGVGLSEFCSYQPISGSMGSYGTPDVTISRDTTTNIAGVASLKFTKPASNCLGQGFSYDLDIDPAYQAAPLQINFLNGSLSGTYVDGDITVWIYDKTNKKMIQPSANRLMKRGMAGEVQPLEFQTAYNSTSYRLIFHVSSVSAAAYELAFDNISVGPKSKSVGAVVTDWESFTPTGSWTGTATYTGRKRRVGDTLEAQVRILLIGAATAASLTVSLPPGLTIDTSKVAAGNYGSIVGFTEVLSAAYNIDASGVVLVVDARNVAPYSTTASGSYAGIASINQASPRTFTAGDSVSLNFEVPILGWSSNTVMSDSASLGPVSLSVRKSVSQSIADSTPTTILYDTVERDTLGSYNPITGIYTIKTAGDYSGFAKIECGWSVGNVFAWVAATGKDIQQVFGKATSVGNWTIPIALPGMKVGDEVKVRISQNSGGPQNAASSGNTYSHFYLSNVSSGQQQIAASETIAARYSTGAGQSIPSGVSTIVDFGDRTFDTHGSVTTGASWRFTAQVPGFFDISVIANINLSSVTTTFIHIFKNNNLYSQGQYIVSSAVPQSYGVTSTDIVPLLAGEFIDARIFQNSGGARGLGAAASMNYINIKRIGGV